MLRRLKEWAALRRAGRYIKEFEDPIEASHRRAAGDLLEAAKRALANGKLEKAYESWQEALNHHRMLVRGSSAGLHILFALNKLDDATALVEEGSKQEPQNPFFCEAAALIALRRKDHGEVVRHYEILRKRFPRHGKGYREAIPSLVALHRLDEADHLMRHIARNSHDPALIIEYARLAMTRRDWSEAMRRWARIPIHEAAILGQAECLKELGRFDEAERLLRDALKTPRLSSLACWIGLACVAEARGNWADAASQWADVRLLAPARQEGYLHGVAALRKCGREDDAMIVIHEAEKILPKEVINQLTQAGLDVGAPLT